MQIIDNTLIKANAYVSSSLPPGRQACLVGRQGESRGFGDNEVSTALDLTNLDCARPDNINVKIIST